MHVTYAQTLLQPSDGVAPVSCLAWAPNNVKLTAASADRVVHVFDEGGAKRDKFKTKAADGNTTGAYLVRGLAFSPDSTKLAVAQSDNIVFVYRLGADWEEKKSICNKFVQHAAVTSVCWPAQRPNEVVFGLADGKVKVGMLKANKTFSMYSHSDGSYVLALAGSSSGGEIVSAHADGSLFKFSFPAHEGQAPAYAKLLQHTCAPRALAWGGSICAAGGDCKVVFYEQQSGRQLQAFDFSSDEASRDFGCAVFSPSGDAAVVGAHNRLYVFAVNHGSSTWQHVAVKQVDNLFTTTALAWNPDGSRLAVGGQTGTLALFDTCLRRCRYKASFELTYVSNSTIVVKALASGSRTVLSSAYGYDITKVDVFQDRYVVGRTHATLMLGNMDSCRMSEVAWDGDGTEAFHFASDSVCLVFRDGSVSAVEYGCNNVLAVCRTELVSPYLLSVAAGVAVSHGGGAGDTATTTTTTKRLAYLVDAHTLRVVDLAAGGGPLATVSHDAKIDWLELNSRGSHLLFRDKRQRLHLLEVASQQRSSLQDFCQFVQLLPGSDILVAQSRASLCVWYNIDRPDRRTCVPIKGDVEGIQRVAGRTQVLVGGGCVTTAYTLDEGLVAFGAALEAQDLHAAMAALEPLELTAETRGHWAQLAALAVQQEALAVAERCYAATGDVAKARLLHKLVKGVQHAEGASDTQQLPMDARAQLAALSQQWPVGEALLLAQGRVDEAISLYQQAHRWDDAVRVADTCRHPQSNELRRAHHQWLLASGQDGKAGALQEKAGDLLGAIGLYLKAGLPARAAQVIISHRGSYNAALLESIAAALSKAGLHERCGDLHEHLGRPQEALQAFRQARAYRKAVKLARGVSPAAVIVLEEEWGDWLAGQRQLDAAVNHFIEAGATVKAIEAALADRQCAKAAGIVDFLEPRVAAPYFRRIAVLYEDAGNREQAERYHLAAGATMDAVDMWMRAGNWEAAHRVARGHLPPQELQQFYTKRAAACEAARQFADAEKAYVAAGQVDAAMAMYKANRMWVPLLSLVQQQRREQLPQVHLAVAQALQAEGAWREAERHFCEAKDWKAAVAMYRQQGAWEDALRVAKALSGAEAAAEVAYAWATSLAEEEAAALLRRLNIGEGVVDHAVETGAFSHAFKLAQLAAPHKLRHVHLNFAMFLEDSGRLTEAEGEFVAAGKPREAIDMYIHAQDWAAATRVAQQHEPRAATDVVLAQASAAAAAQDFQAAEGLFLQVQRPDAALDMHRAAGQWQAALQLAQAYLPGKVQEVHMEMAAHMSSGAAAGGAPAVARARALEQGHDYARALDAYLALTPADTGDDLDLLQQCWEQAAGVAVQHQRHRVQEVVAGVVQRLVGIQRAGAAADLQQGVGDVQGAVQTLCAGGLFERAQQLAGTNAQLLQLVDAQHTQHLVANNDAEELASRGNAAAAADMFAAQGNWTRVHQLVAQAGPPEVAASYAARHADVLMRRRDWAAAAAVLATRSVAAQPQHFQLYRDVALEVLGARMQDRQPAAEEHARAMLHALQQQLQASAQVQAQDVADFKRLFWAAHLTALAGKSRQAGLLEMAARQLTALLRFIGIVPADRALYEAGAAWKAAGRPSMAFVILNRYLDVADAQEDPGGASSLAQLENADFARTDVPFDVPVPEHPYATEDAREEARNYVLEMSMDASLEQALGTAPCEHCGADTYEAALACPSCGGAWEPCVVSGYPTRAAERLVLPRSNMSARRADWNAWVGRFKSDPITGASAAPMF